jgi:catechol 2,3-dioxygenase-like lactoylglutathione lyase family enzyme
VKPARPSYDELPVDGEGLHSGSHVFGPDDWVARVFVNPATGGEMSFAKAGSRVRFERMHPTAYVSKDHEATRRFYEDILGIPLVASWAEVNEFLNFPVRKIEYCHTFFALDSGACIAFFGLADDDIYEATKSQLGLAHLAIYVSAEDQLKIKAGLEAAGQSPFMINHGFCVSLYSKGRDGLTVEFASEPENREEMAA